MFGFKRKGRLRSSLADVVISDPTDFVWLKHIGPEAVPVGEDKDKTEKCGARSKQQSLARNFNLRIQMTTRFCSLFFPLALLPFLFFFCTPVLFRHTVNLARS